MEQLKETSTNSISVINIGATKEEGGSRKSVVKIGGQTALPYLFNEGQLPHRPVIALEVWDVAPIDWPEALNKEYLDVYSDTAAWAKKAVKDSNVDLVCLKLQGAHPDSKNKSPEDCAKVVGDILKAVDVPLIILGSGDDAKDNLIFPSVSEAAKGERILVGDAVRDSYKTLTVAALADGHNIIAESPIDINIAKQLNILIGDMGLAQDRIVINPTVGALGYGLEYAYSIMERGRLAALSGDKFLAMPFICFVGQEAWRAKEAKALESEFPQWGDAAKRGIAWETLTAVAFIQSGADILLMRHPTAVKNVKKYIDELMIK